MPLTLATFNVKDLFDAKDGASRASLESKLEALAAVIERADADVLALQEVGSADGVRALAARAPRLGYGEPIVGTADTRGIRCALLTRLPVLHSRVHTAAYLTFPAFVTGDPPPFGDRVPLRRGVPHVRVDAGPLGSVDVLAVHFKSNRGLPLQDAAGGEIAPKTERDYAEGSLRSLVWRACEALFVRGLVDDLLAGAPAAHVAIAGDLNDHPGSHVVRIVAGRGDRGLAPCADLVPPAARFSILLRGQPQQIDHLLVTPGLRSRQTGARFLNEGLRDHGSLDPAVAVPDSDHAPLVATFA